MHICWYISSRQANPSNMQFSSGTYSPKASTKAPPERARPRPQLWGKRHTPGRAPQRHTWPGKYSFHPFPSISISSRMFADPTPQRQQLCKQNLLQKDLAKKFSSVFRPELLLLLLSKRQLATLSAVARLLADRAPALLSAVSFDCWRLGRLSGDSAERGLGSRGENHERADRSRWWLLGGRREGWAKTRPGGSAHACRRADDYLHAPSRSGEWTSTLE
jgi:hypothetical protein